ncbi:VA0D1 [Hepatospora eriocheir]|uniref:VA0D1 n=1 Tax=Hepatospora eriocheir TaxID=1081669 RepID=A0A1X0QFG1_9MICR|nr:VA0D1 [Hepatospora eriocheir]
MSELKQTFIINLKRELNEFSEYNLTILNYFTDYYKIISLFNKINKIKINELGEFPELKAIELCNNFKEIKAVCINNSSLQKYFVDLDGNETNMFLEVMKNLMNNYYESSKGYFKEILEVEGDRQILEIALSNLQDKSKYFPNCTTLNKLQLTELSKNLSKEEVVQIFNLSNDNFMNEILIKIVNVYKNSFNQFDDLSCIYAYFKLKEIQIRNIIWIIQCKNNNMEDKQNEIIKIN